ncbi:MAG: metallophosphoesterase family protein [Anaerolineae bacterium]|nr:metallophosphoesterase family protein [Anaerolineae bacterium]
MIATQESITTGAYPWYHPLLHQDIWQMITHKQLSKTFKDAEKVSFDDNSRFIFFSDTHRGDNSATDEFARNESLFLYVLSQYYNQGFTYIEVGDGEELWKNKNFDDIRKAHGQTFEMLHQFDDQQRLHLLYGNHDITAYRKAHYIDKDGMLAREGLILSHKNTGQYIFVTHGHQADIKSDRLKNITRPVIRHIWRRIQLLGFGRAPRLATKNLTRRSIEQRLITWVEDNHQPIICGHTHRPISTADNRAPYFNTGCCIVPNILTGLELQQGEILQVKWTINPLTKQVLREVTAPAVRLSIYN